MVYERCVAADQAAEDHLSNQLKLPKKKLTEDELNAIAKTVAARRKRAEIRRFKILSRKVLSGSGNNGLGPGLSKGICGGGGTSGGGGGGSGRRLVAAAAVVKQIVADDIAATSMIFATAKFEDELVPSRNEKGEALKQVERDMEERFPASRSAASKFCSSLPSATCKSITIPSFGIVSICGRSTYMEDFAVGIPSFFSSCSASSEKEKLQLTLATENITEISDFHYFAVYDGHGGSQAAQYCKERLHCILVEEIKKDWGISGENWDKWMKASFQRADVAVCAGEGGVPGFAGSTAVAGVVTPRHLVVANCGDSRALLVRRGSCIPLSHDHKPDRPDELARIEAAGGHVINWQGYRVLGVLAMSRAIGDRFLKPYVIGEPEVTSVERNDDDLCLILASDGLWDVLSNDAVSSIAHETLSTCFANKQSSIEHSQHALLNGDTEIYHKASSNFTEKNNSFSQVVANRLTRCALAKNSKDNISVVVVDLRRQ